MRLISIPVQRTIVAPWRPGSSPERPWRADVSMAREKRLTRLFIGIAMGAFACAAAAAGDGDYARRLEALVNQYRASHGRPALAIDATIAGLAREHSLAM